jgi:uncharacterized protein (DUF1501 family)
MFISKMSELSRRALLRRSGQLAVAGSASSYALGLVGMGEAAAFSSVNDYKALVCVFLYGGNDHANTLIPFDKINYEEYRRIRRDIAIPRSDLANTVLVPADKQQLTDDLQFAIAPTMPKLKSYFEQGHLAALLNVGPLEAPITKGQYESSNVVAYPRPDKLFSHNDQQSTWQASRPEGARSGWGGRIADLALAANQNAMFTAINATGNAVFLSGKVASPFKVNTKGAPTIYPLDRLYGSASAGSALRAIIRQHHQHVFEQDYAETMRRSIDYGKFVNDAIKQSDVTVDFNEDNSLAAQLSVVAKIIGARGSLGVRRQIFMVSMGGFDHHNNLRRSHPPLLAKLDEALDQFYRATVQLGVADSVTTFTASDFGRTLTSNGDGTDHGWGAHHFILGGAVAGQRFYGTAPHVSTESDDQVGRGRLLPTTSVDEYSATLALWFGVQPSELESISPNIGRFSKPDLGFLRH